MDLTLLMWTIIPTLVQIMKRMMETSYRCDKIYVLPTCTNLTHRVVGVIFPLAQIVYSTNHLPEFD